MSNVNVVHGEPEVEIELTDFEKNHLVQACMILKNIAWDLFTQDADETNAYMNASAARDTLQEFLKKDLGISTEDTE